MNVYLGANEIDPNTLGSLDIEGIYKGTDEVRTAEEPMQEVILYNGGNGRIVHGYNSTDGYIKLLAFGTYSPSLSADEGGKVYSEFIISDRNLGATQYYDYGTSIIEDNYQGNVYEWGNNYGFSVNGASNTSFEKVDTTGYGPGNYYSSSTYITSYYSGGDRWDSPANNNLWGDTTDTEIARQGPCPSGWHIPSFADGFNLLDMLAYVIGAGSVWSLTLDNIRDYLRIGPNYILDINGSTSTHAGTDSWAIWTTSTTNAFYGYTSYNGPEVIRSNVEGRPIRPFKNGNTPVS